MKFKTNVTTRLGSARDSRAGDGDLAIANFSPDGLIPSAEREANLRSARRFVAASRRNQHASRVRSPAPVRRAWANSAGNFLRLTNVNT